MNTSDTHTNQSHKGEAKFAIGRPVKHRIFGFRGVIFDVDPVFANTEEWYKSIPEKMRPDKNQPFYHLLAVSKDDDPYIAYVSQQNLEPSDDADSISHPAFEEYFEKMDDGSFISRTKAN